MHLSLDATFKLVSVPTSNHPDWSIAQHFVLGYGSLLSDDSRLQHSDNPNSAVAVEVEGFERRWITRAFHEQQTYVGVTPKAGAQINAHCIPFTLDEALQKREQDYRFVRVDRKLVTLLSGATAMQQARLSDEDTQLWICESLAVHPAHAQYPIYQSYIDTCLSGCLSFYAHDMALASAHARRFIQTTQGWQHVINDRHSPQYPRHAIVDPNTIAIIDDLMLLIEEE